MTLHIKIEPFLDDDWAVAEIQRMTGIVEGVKRQVRDGRMMLFFAIEAAGGTLRVRDSDFLDFDEARHKFTREYDAETGEYVFRIAGGSDAR